MADIELVIKIPDHYDLSKIQNGSIASKIILEAVKNGTPLPKGHSNLCDENQVVASLVRGNYLKEGVKCGDITKILDRATIIEADEADKGERMKVSELIEQLKKLPLDSDIGFESYDEVFNAEIKWRGGSDEPYIYLSHKYDKGKKPFYE